MSRSLGPSESHEAAKSPTCRYIDAKAVGRMFGCSWRHILRLADAGKFPWGVKLGSLRRWDVEELEEFAANGCRLSPRANPV